MKPKLPILVIPLTTLLGIVLILQSDGPAESAAANVSAEKTAAASGMMLYVDPNTGEFLQSPPESFPVEMSEEGAYGSSSLGLAETAAPVGGGRMMDLHGRFRQTFRAAIDASGNLSASCGPAGSTSQMGSKGGKEVEQP